MEKNNLATGSKEARENRKNLIKEKPDHPFSNGLKQAFPLDAAKEILEKGDPLEFLINTVGKLHVGDKAVVAWHICSGLSSGLRDRKNTIHIQTVGNSGKGKSASQDHTGLIFENIETITSSSAKSQFYKAEAGILPNGGIIRFDESEGSEEALILERALTDKSLLVPTHDTVSINRQFKQLKIKQINAVWKNSVSPPEDEQVNNRYIILNVDESPEQDIAVLKRQINLRTAFKENQ